MLLTRKGMLALAAAGLLLSAASAQSGGGYPEVKRDPFINNQVGAPALTPPIIRTPDSGKPQPFRRQDKNIPVHPSEQPVTTVVIVPAPEVTVSGIVASAGQRQAIITTDKGSRIVTVGQRLADYRVKAIDAKSVTFEAQGKSFKIPLAES